MTNHHRTSLVFQLSPLHPALSVPTQLSGSANGPAAHPRPLTGKETKQRAFRKELYIIVAETVPTGEGMNSTLNSISTHIEDSYISITR